MFLATAVPRPVVSPGEHKAYPAAHRCDHQASSSMWPNQSQPYSAAVTTEQRSVRSIIRTKHGAPITPTAFTTTVYF